MNEKEIQLLSDKLGVEKKIIESWQDKFQIVNYKIGELILNANSTAKSILLLINGKIRLRGILNNKSNKIFSLGILEPLEIIGLTSHRMKKPIEIVSAGSDCVFLSIPFEDWILFKEEINNEALQIIDKKVDLSELWYLINNNFSNFNFPDDPRELKRFLKIYQESILLIRTLEDYKNLIKNNISNYKWFSLEKIRTISQLMKS